MRKIIKKALLILCILILVSSCSANTNDDANVEEEINDEIELIVEESQTYVYFGSYPQREVVSKVSEFGTYGKVFFSEDDYILDEELYDDLKILSEEEWNNNDAMVGDNKYRRIKASDATYSTFGDDNYYEFSSNEYHYFKYEPIKWIVLKQNDDNAFLLSEVALDDQMYNTEIKNITWQTSTIRSWLNGYASSENLYGTDYSENNFINMAFTSSEQSKILTTTLVNNDNSKNGTEGGENTEDKIFLLSEDEVYGDSATEYGFAKEYKEDDILRQCKSSTYAKAMGTYTDGEDLGNCFWWLRSPGSYTGLFVLVRCDGSVYRGGQHANSKSRGVRPAMYIALN